MPGRLKARSPKARAKPAAKAPSRLKHLYAELQRSHEESRRALARRLHNETQQNLAALSMQLALLERQMGQLDTPISDRVRRPLGEALALVAACNRELREVAQALSPPLLELGLLPALRGLASELGEARLVLVVDDLPRFEPRVECAAYRLIVDALGLTFAASRAVRVALSAHGAHLVLTLEGAIEPGEIVDLAVLRHRLRAEPLGARVRARKERRALRLDVRFAPTAAAG